MGAVPPPSIVVCWDGGDHLNINKVEAIFGEYQDKLNQNLRGVWSSRCYTESLGEKELLGNLWARRHLRWSLRGRHGLPGMAGCLPGDSSSEDHRCCSTASSTCQHTPMGSREPVSSNHGILTIPLSSGNGKEFSVPSGDQEVHQCYRPGTGLGRQ